jgi:hypothetical protein
MVHFVVNDTEPGIHDSFPPGGFFPSRPGDD